MQDKKPQNKDQLPGALIAIAMFVAFALPGIGFIIVLPAVAFLYKKLSPQTRKKMFGSRSSSTKKPIHVSFKQTPTNQAPVSNNSSSIAKQSDPLAPANTRTLRDMYNNGTALTLDQLKSDEFKRKTKDII